MKMKYTVSYSETSSGTITFEADSIGQAQDLVAQYRRGEAVEAIDNGNKAERNYEIELTGSAITKEVN